MRTDKQRQCRQFWIEINGARVTVNEGEMLGHVLMRFGYYALRRSPVKRQSRGMFCGMGICFECLVSIIEPDGRQRKVCACITPVAPRMRVITEVSSDETTRSQ